MVQSGKWVDVNLSGLFVSGFEFQLKRRTGSAGSVVLGPICGERRVISVDGKFTPNTLDTTATGFAVLPDYTSQARILGAAAGVTITQNPLPGTSVGAGRMTVTMLAEDADGHQAHTGFELNIRDKTPPVVAKPTPSWAPPVLISPSAMPDLTVFMTKSDNVGVTRVQQSPAPGTINSVGTFAVTISASDAAGNVGTLTFPITVESAFVEGETHYSSLAAKGSAVPGSGMMGIPDGAIFRTLGIPSINDSRSSAFQATWAKGALTGKTILAGNPLQPVTGSAQPAPGIPGAKFSTFLDPVLNNAGTSDAIAFRADVTGTGITTANNAGVWTNLGGQLQLIAREQATAPGTDVSFKSFTAINLFADEILITATLAGPGVAGSNDAGLWSWSPERGMKLILREGQLILDVKKLATIQILTSISGSAGHGRHHLGKGFHAARITCSDGTSAAVFIDCSGPTPVVEPIAISRQAVVPGFTPTSVGTPSGSISGTAAFTATASTGPAVIFSREQSDGRQVNSIAARRGGAIAPGLTWNTFRDPVLNVGGAAAWFGQMSGATASDNDVLAFTPNGGTPTIIAREGVAAPDTDSVFNTFTALALPDGAAGPLFSATLRIGKGTATSANDTGLWAVSSTGEIILLFREGDSFGSRIIRRIQALDLVGGSPGQARSFNSTGSAIVLLTLSDGSQSIVRADVP